MIVWAGMFGTPGLLGFVLFAATAGAEPVAADPTLKTLFPAAAAFVGALSLVLPGRIPVPQAGNAAQMRMIVGLALSEAVALLGFVASFSTANASAYPPYLFASWALMILHFPRRTRP